MDPMTASGASDGLLIPKSEEDVDLIPTTSEWKKALTVVRKHMMAILACVILGVVCVILAFLLATPMDWKGWYSLWVTAVVLVLLSAEVLAPALAFIFSLMLLTVPNVISMADALKGFGNDLVFAIGLLYIVSRGIKESTLLNYVVKYALGKPSTTERALLRLVPSVMAMSAFMNNTPIVAMFIPAVQQWARENDLPVRQLLMPLSFAAILGGTCTQIGTSVNMVAGSLQSGLDGAEMSFFEVGYAGFPISVLSCVYMCLTARHLLPEQAELPSDVSDTGDTSRRSTLWAAPRPFYTFMEVVATGLTLEEAGLGQTYLKGLGLLLHDVDGIPVEDQQQVLPERSVIKFSGSSEAITSRLYRMDTLRHVDAAQVSKLTVSFHKRKLCIAVVSVGSSLVGKTIDEVAFRNLYGAVVVALRAAHGNEINALKGHELAAGDSLLLEASELFLNHAEDDDFACVSQVSGDSTSILPRDRPLHALLAAALVIFIVAAAGTGALKLAQAAMLTCFSFLFARTISVKQALGSVSGQTLIVIASGFGLTQALHATGASDQCASLLKVLFAGHSDILLFFGIFLVTSLLANIINPVATVNLMFPIVFAISQASQKGNVEQCLGCLMIAASCSLCTPFSYQTNLMVAEAAGYSAFDFLKFGGPLLFLVMASTVLLAQFVVWGPGHVS